MTKPRALFFGTPDFAVPALQALHEVAEVTLVVTQPDRPKGRGMKLAPPPVKQRAIELGLPVLQPTKVRTPEFAASLREQNAELALVIAYGRILPKAVLEAPRLGCVNVHASLLPKLRGAAPIQWSIVRGENETGVCLMQMDEGLDTGPVLACARLAIDPNETTAELSPRLSALGAQLVREKLASFVAGELRATPQDEAQATLAPLLSKDDGAIDWSRSARELHNLARGFSPWPGAFSWLAGTRLKLLSTQVSDEDTPHSEPGVLLQVSRDGIDVACGRGSLRLLELQLEGAKRLRAAEFGAGQRLIVGQRLERPTTL
jgi:methionyl-tRNA formyltransferase